MISLVDVLDSWCERFRLSDDQRSDLGLAFVEYVELGQLAGASDRKLARLLNCRTLREALSKMLGEWLANRPPSPRREAVERLLPGPPTLDSPSSVVSVKKKRSVCGVCGVEGHNARTHAKLGRFGSA